MLRQCISSPTMEPSLASGHLIPISTAAIVLVCVFGGALLGIFIRGRIPESHLRIVISTARGWVWRSRWGGSSVDLRRQRAARRACGGTSRRARTPDWPRAGRRRGQARARPASDARPRFWLPAEALVELEGGGGLEQRINGVIVLGAGGPPHSGGPRAGATLAASCGHPI